MPEFLFVHRGWLNPVFPKMFYINDVECHDFLGSYVALEVNNIAHNILGFKKKIIL